MHDTVRLTKQAVLLKLQALFSSQQHQRQCLEGLLGATKSVSLKSPQHL